MTPSALDCQRLWSLTRSPVRTTGPSTLAEALLSGSTQVMMTIDSLSARSEVSGFIVVGVDGSDEAVHALAWAVDFATRRHLAVEVVTIWSFPAMSIELPSTGRVLHRHALELARHAVEMVVTDREAAGTAVPEIHVEAYLSHPAERLVLASREADLLVVARGRQSVLGSTSRGVTQHATCPVAVIPAPDNEAPPTSLSTRLSAEHPRVAQAIEAVSQHLSAMGI